MGIHNVVVRKVISFTLLVCLIITNISPALAQESNHQIALDPAQFTDMNPDKFMQNPQNLSEEEKAELKRFLNQPTEVTLEILFLLKNLYHKVKMEEQKLGTEAVTKILSKRKDSQSIEFEVENLGKAEPLVINTSRGPLFFTKVRHNKLKMVMLFIDKSQIDMQFLIESEKRVKNGFTFLDPTLDGLTQEQIKLELDHRQFILKQMRTLYAKMLMSEWNPKLEYLPLHEQIEKSKVSAETPPEELKSKVADVMEAPFSELQEKPWFKELSSKSFNTWMDLAKQEELAKTKTQGNEALMLMMFNSQEGKSVEALTVKKASKFSLEYWKTWWGSIYERPAYSETVWNNNQGIGKLKVLLTGDYLVGLGFGVSLGLISSATALLLPTSLPHGLNALDVGLISFGYSLFFGVFGKTWANFVYKGNEFLRFTKNWAPGIAQSYTFNLLSTESLALLKADGRFDLNAIKTHSDILINQSIKTVTKTSLQEIPRTRAKTGEAEGTLKIPYYKIVLPWQHNMKFMEIEATETRIDTLKLAKWIRNQFMIDDKVRPWEEKFILKFHRDWKISAPWLVRQEFETYIPRQNFENQAIQFVTTPVGLLSRFGFTVGGIPVGHLLYMLLGPIGEVRQIRYKRQYADLLAQNYGENHALTKRYRKLVADEITAWNNLKIFNVPGTQFIGYYLKTVPIQVWETSKVLANWLARKTAYHTYKIYQSIEEDLKRSAQARADADAVGARYRQLMTVQTDGGKPHPKQIADGIVTYQKALCSSLFQ